MSPVIRVPGEGPWNPLAAAPNPPPPPVDDAVAAVRGQIGSWARQGMAQFAVASLDEVRGQYGISAATAGQALAVLEAEGLIEAAGGGRWTIRTGP